MEFLRTLGEYLTQHNVVEALKLPSECPRYKLSDLLTAVKGKVPGELTWHFTDQVQPYITIKAFERGIIDQYVASGDGVPVSENDLIIVWDGARCGLIGQGKNGILGSTLKKLSLKEQFNHVPLSYVRYFLQSQYRVLNGYSRGSVIQHVDPSLFWSLKLPIPDQNDKRFKRMCTLFNALDEVEKHTQRQLKLVRQMRDSLLHHAFRLEQ